MQPGQTLTDGNGHQVCLFPLQVININQLWGPNSYSHCCSKAVDYGTGGTPTPAYAPCDIHLVYDPQRTAHTLFYSSDSPVVTPSGLSYISIEVIHCDTEHFDPQPHFNQGDLFYWSGNAGIQSTGVHLHMEQNLLPDSIWINYHISCIGTTGCYGLPDSVSPAEVFYVNDTQVVNGRGLPWKKYEGGQPEPPDNPERPPAPAPPAGSGGRFKWYLFADLIKRRRL